MILHNYIINNTNSVRREARMLHCNCLVMWQIRMLFNKTDFSLNLLYYYGTSNHV